MAVNFMEMPFADKLSNGFDALNANSVTSDNWQNQIGNTNFILQNAVYNDDAISLTGSNVGYLPIAEPEEYTAYILCRAKDVTPTGSRYAQIFGTRDASSRNYAAISIGTSDTYKLRSYNTKTYVNPTLDNWHILTLVRTDGYFYIYADGKLIISEANSYTTRGDKFMIKSISEVGVTPTVDEAITVQIKCCIILNTVQTSIQIKANAEWLLAQYGLGILPLNSKMSGADAAAIAWCIARNLEQTNSLIMQKKLFKEGLKKGIEGGADITEEFEQDTPNINISTDGDGAISEPFIGQFTDGIYYTDPTGAYVKMWLDMSYQIGSGDNIRTGQMVYEAYDADGTLLDTWKTTGSGNWAWTSTEYDEHVVKVVINGSAVTCTHAQTINGTTGYYNMDWSPVGVAFSIMDNAVRVSNIPPEIIN